jgi:hypothetical protein
MSAMSSYPSGDFYHPGHDQVAAIGPLCSALVPCLIKQPVQRQRLRLLAFEPGLVRGGAAGVAAAVTAARQGPRVVLLER